MAKLSPWNASRRFCKSAARPIFCSNDGFSNWPNGITVHQYASLYAVPFAPEMETTVAYFNMEEK